MVSRVSPEGKTGGCLRWPGRAIDQDTLTLVRSFKGETFAELVAGFGVGTATIWRYATETVSLLAARSPKLAERWQRPGTPGTPTW